MGKLNSKIIKVHIIYQNTVIQRNSSSIRSTLLPSYSQFGPCWSVSNIRPQYMFLVHQFIKENLTLKWSLFQGDHQHAEKRQEINFFWSSEQHISVALQVFKGYSLFWPFAVAGQWWIAYDMHQKPKYYFCKMSWLFDRGTCCSSFFEYCICKGRPVLIKIWLKGEADSS